MKPSYVICMDINETESKLWVFFFQSYTSTKHKLTFLFVSKDMFLSTRNKKKERKTHRIFKYIKEFV